MKELYDQYKDEDGFLYFSVTYMEVFWTQYLFNGKLTKNHDLSLTNISELSG
jgi:hypothetical protein